MLNKLAGSEKLLYSCSSNMPFSLTFNTEEEQEEEEEAGEEEEVEEKGRWEGWVGLLAIIRFASLPARRLHQPHSHAFAGAVSFFTFPECSCGLLALPCL